MNKTILLAATCGVLALSACGGSAAEPEAKAAEAAAPATTQAPTTTAAPTTTQAPTTTAAPTTTLPPTTTAPPTTAPPTLPPQPVRDDVGAAHYIDVFVGLIEPDLMAVCPLVRRDPALIQGAMRVGFDKPGMYEQADRFLIPHDEFVDMVVKAYGNRLMAECA